MINERSLTPAELEKREKVIMKMKGNKRDLVKKYGKDAEAVMYGRATNMAKKKTENMRNSKLTELIKDALKNPKKADLDKDGKLSSYEKTRGAAIEKNISEDDDLESGQYGDPKVGNYDITSQNDNEAGDIEALSAAGLEEAIADLDPKKALIKLKDAAKEKGKDIKAFIKTADGLDILTTLFPGFAAAGGLMEDIDIGHEDNEPGMLQGDLYQIGKASMELYELLDDMEGQGEVDLPSWWQAKIFKAKEAIVGAQEYLEFELKEPAIDAIVDKVAPLEIEVDPLGETVEDFITSVDDLTEVELPSSALMKMNQEVKSPKTMAALMVNLYDAIQDKEGIDYSKNQKFSRALSFLKDLADDEEEVADDEKVDESFKSLAKKVDKQKGVDKEYAGKIAGKIANIKRKGGGSGPTAKQKKRMSEDETNESFGSLAKKIDKQKGKSKKDAANIAGYIANIKRKGGGSGPTAKQKKRMAETILKQIRK